MSPKSDEKQLLVRSVKKCLMFRLTVISVTFSLKEGPSVMRAKKKVLLLRRTRISSNSCSLLFSDCPDPLCEECGSVHQTVAFLKKHKIVSLEEVLKKGSIDLGKSPLCSIHKKELDLYCHDHTRSLL